MNTQRDKNLFALCFSVIAAWFKKHQWAIIPAGILATIGLGSEVDIHTPASQATGPVFMFMFAATFTAYAILSKKNWWAIIPAGIFATLGVVVVLEHFVPHQAFPALPDTLTWGIYTWVLFLGLAATFGTLWLLRKSQPTNWAIYPAVGFLSMAVLSAIEGARFSAYWLETTLLVFGVMLLLAVINAKSPATAQQVPKINP